MAATAIDAVDMQDLEDGEIESDDEEVKNDVSTDKKEEEINNAPEEPQIEKNNKDTDVYRSKASKKKRSKNKEQKLKDKSKKHKYTDLVDDDFAGNIEKALRKVLNKKNEEESENNEDGDERRKRKKRKRYSKEGFSKKKKKEHNFDDVDESEMMCIRGASPVQKQSSVEIDSDDRDSYHSDSSVDSRERHSRLRHRNQRDRKNKNDRDRRRGTHPMQDPDGVCVYYMQGKCHKGDDCIYSHDALPPRKMELCKFYMMDCCAKRDKCLYLHGDFPCKYYHTGLPCIQKDYCKFAHGKPLTENLKMCLLKHLESAPKEILGDFPRLNREEAMKRIANTQMKLMQQFANEGNNTPDKNIPSLFDLDIPKPEGFHDKSNSNQGMINDKINKNSNKVRQSRWQNDGSPHMNSNVTGTPDDVFSVKNLNGMLTSKQISDLTVMGIENLDQLSQLTVSQLTTLGISLKQIGDIQLNTQSIQKLGLVGTIMDVQPGSPIVLTSVAGSKDMDLRVPPTVPISSLNTISDVGGKDVDMRFQQSRSILPTSEENKSTDPRVNKNMIDIDQYTKDALKFAKDKENIANTNDTFENEQPYFPLDPRITTVHTKDVDQRVLKFGEDDSDVFNKSRDNSGIKKESDTDIRFLQPEPLFKSHEKRNRLSTTDDEDNNLLIDEKWYSSDEEKCGKRKSPTRSPVIASSPSTNVEPATVLSKLGDLSQFSISNEVSELLKSMKNNLQETKPVEKSTENNDTISRDPRNSMKKSPDHKVLESTKGSHKKPPRISIYECIEGEPTDGRRRSDVDLRKSDFNLPTFGDTDLRPNSSGDTDFRLSLPFKAIPNYTPASEIDGSINSHPPILYKLMIIDIPRPDYTDIRNSTAKSQAMLDPRLRKVFRLSVDESNSDNEKSTKTSTSPRVDPRRKPKDSVEIQEQKSPSLDLQTVLQNSDWFKDLSSTQKIFVNQNLALVTSMMKQFNQDKTVGKKFDLAPIQNNPILCNIFNNLGILLNENGEVSYLPKPKEALLKTPVNFNKNFGSANLDSNNMNIMNQPPHMNMGGPMPGFNHGFSDPRNGPTPGLLGIAPNIPHNFDNSFSGPNNYGNMQFNGPNKDFGPMDIEQNYQRFPNRGGFRGRGHDRWNRGGSRGQRQNFSDRGGWKGERN